MIRDEELPLDPLSLVSLHLEAVCGGKIMGPATGFVVQERGMRFLFSCRHVFTGLNCETGQGCHPSGFPPEHIRAWFPQREPDGWVWRGFTFELREDGVPRWLTPANPEIDIACLPISVPHNLEINPLDMGLEHTDLLLTTAEPVSIIGFPMGESGGGKFPIWKTAFVASELGLLQDGHEKFLIDGRTKPGMSGSPVYAKRVGSFRAKRGSFVIGEAARFLGIYSGRRRREDDIGVVWEAFCITQLFYDCGVKPLPDKQVSDVKLVRPVEWKG